MELKDAIRGRHSIRGFKQDPVSQEVLRQILDLAARAPSGVNSQPWEFFVVTGDSLAAIQAENMALLTKAEPEDRLDAPVPDGVYRNRSRDIGKKLLMSMGIAREDRERRNWWMKRGYRFFDAPAVIFIAMDEVLDETAYRLDIGCAAQTICLAALEYGLGTCIEDQAITYQRSVRKYVDVPKSKRFACGIAIGYPDPEFAANHVISTREDVDQITTWYGF